MTMTLRRVVSAGYSVVPCSGENFCRCREDDAAGGPVEQLAQFVAVAGLLRRLAQQVLAHAERAEKLVVEVVAVGEHDERRVFHRGVLDDLPGVERHEQALAGALRVPDDADLAVAVRAGGGERAVDGLPDGVELVIAGENLGEAAAGVAEDDEVLDEVEEAALVEHALEDGFQLGRALGREVVAGDGAPRHEPLAVSGQRADAGVEAVGNHEHRVRAEQRRNLRLVGLQLVEGAVDGGVLVAGILEFDHAQRQAVDEDHDVGPAVGLVLDDGVLVDGEPVVGVGVVEVDQSRLLAADGAIASLTWLRSR